MSERDGAVLAPGTELRIVKVSPEGDEVTHYPGWVFATGEERSWIGARADWVRKIVEMDGLQFVPGDRLHEFFSLDETFNVFSVWSPEGTLRGWYANVTHPTRLGFDTSPASLYWHDLYVDVIALPDGRLTVRDEDELAAAGLEQTDPDLHAMILATRDRIIERFRLRAFPFHER